MGNNALFLLLSLSLACTGYQYAITEEDNFDALENFSEVASVCPQWLSHLSPDSKIALKLSCYQESISEGTSLLSGVARKLDTTSMKKGGFLTKITKGTKSVVSKMDKEFNTNFIRKHSCRLFASMLSQLPLMLSKLTDVRRERRRSDKPADVAMPEELTHIAYISRYSGDCEGTHESQLVRGMPKFDLIEEIDNLHCANVVNVLSLYNEIISRKLSGNAIDILLSAGLTKAETLDNTKIVRAIKMLLSFGINKREENRGIRYSILQSILTDMLEDLKGTDCQENVAKWMRALETQCSCAGRILIRDVNFWCGDNWPIFVPNMLSSLQEPVRTEQYNLKEEKYHAYRRVLSKRPEHVKRGAGARRVAQIFKDEVAEPWRLTKLDGMSKISREELDLVLEGEPQLERKKAIKRPGLDSAATTEA